MSHRLREGGGHWVFKDLDQRIKIRYIPEMLGGRLDYLLQYPQCDKESAPFEKDGVAKSVPVKMLISDVEDIETAIRTMDEGLKLIIEDYPHICIRQMPSVDIVNGNYRITVRFAYCNDEGL